MPLPPSQNPTGQVKSPVFISLLSGRTLVMTRDMVFAASVAAEFEQNRITPVPGFAFNWNDAREALGRGGFENIVFDDTMISYQAEVREFCLRSGISVHQTERPLRAADALGSPAETASRFPSVKAAAAFIRRVIWKFRGSPNDVRMAGDLLLPLTAAAGC